MRDARWAPHGALTGNSGSPLPGWRPINSVCSVLKTQSPWPSPAGAPDCQMFVGSTCTATGRSRLARAWLAASVPGGRASPPAPLTRRRPPPNQVRGLRWGVDHLAAHAVLRLSIQLCIESTACVSLCPVAPSDPLAATGKNSQVACDQLDQAERHAARPARFSVQPSGKVHLQPTSDAGECPYPGSARPWPCAGVAALMVPLTCTVCTAQAANFTRNSLLAERGSSGCLKSAGRCAPACHTSSARRCS